MDEGDDPGRIPVSLVAHHVFCPRRAWLEAVGEHADAEAIAVGLRDAATVDDRSASGGERFLAVDITSDRLGLTGRCDAIVQADGALTVVEHKATPKRRSMDITDAMRLQLALQDILLREMGHEIGGHAIWFSTHKRRVPVAIEDGDREMAERAVAATRATISAPTAPEPLIDNPKCDRCSHAGVCLPDERTRPTRTRRIGVSDPTGMVLHLQTPGSRASLRSGRLEVARREESLASIPIERVAALMIHGNVDVSGALIREMLWRSAAIVWLTGRGRLVGWSVTGDSPNALQRARQHRVSPESALELSREFISAKIANQATLLRRHGDVPEQHRRLRELQRLASQASDVNRLLGIEGDAASRYFSSFSSMLSKRVQDAGFELRTRSRRPATDPMNASLNYSYGLLLSECVRAIASCGLDPSGGFLHTPTRNKPALALDLMEEFRAPIADAVVVGAFNNGELRPEHFTEALGSTRFRDQGRRALIAAFERRITTEFQHPVFGYRVTWRRAIEVQARMILGVIDGSQSAYIGVRTR